LQFISAISASAFGRFKKLLMLTNDLGVANDKTEYVVFRDSRSISWRLYSGFLSKSKKNLPLSFQGKTNLSALSELRCSSYNFTGTFCFCAVENTLIIGRSQVSVCLKRQMSQAGELLLSLVLT
jgi:hypothetical protein